MTGIRSQKVIFSSQKNVFWTFNSRLGGQPLLEVITITMLLKIYRVDWRLSRKRFYHSHPSRFQTCFKASPRSYSVFGLSNISIFHEVVLTSKCGGSLWSCNILFHRGLLLQELHQSYDIIIPSVSLVWRQCSPLQNLLHPQCSLKYLKRDTEDSTGKGMSCCIQDYRRTFWTLAKSTLAPTFD